MNAILILYALGTILDYLTTAWGLAHGAIESNPVMATLIMNHGIERFLVVKMLGIFLVWFFMKLIHKVTPKLAFYSTYFFMAIPQWIFVVNNVFWIRVYLALGV